MRSKAILVVPVYNEEAVLENSIKQLYSYMRKNISDDWLIVIANNASTDNTEKICNHLQKKFPKVNAVHLKQKGRGRALRYVWSQFNADIYSYCDVDLATDISALKDLFNCIKGGNNIVTGSRYLKESKANRTLSRWIMSKAYNLLVRLFFNTKINDFQCGFKAVDKEITKKVMPLVKDNNWFFDTELLLIAESKGYSIKQIPVKWGEGKETKVKFMDTSIGYIKKTLELKKRMLFS